MQAMEWVRTKLADMRDVRLSIEIVQPISGGGYATADLQLEIRGDDLDRLDSISSGVVARMRAAGGYVDSTRATRRTSPRSTSTSSATGPPTWASARWRSASTVRALIGGDDIGKFKAEGDRYDIARASR